MFITTVRVRRARQQSMSQHNVQCAGDVVELLVGGQVRALVAVPEEKPLRVLWADGPWTHDPKGVTQAIAAALGVMAPAIGTTPC